MRPGKERQTQIDGSGIERVDGRVQVQPQIFGGIQGARPRDESLGEVGVDPPIALLVGRGERGTFDTVAEAAVIEFVALRGQAHLDVAQAVAGGQLRKGHCQELLPTRQPPHAAIAIVTRHAALELLVRHKLEDLCEDGLPLVHPASPPQKRRRQHAAAPSNRSRPIWRNKPCAS